MKVQDRVLIVTETLPPDPNGVALIALRTAEILARERCVSLLGPRCLDIPPGVQHLPMRRTPLGNRDVRLPAPNPSLIVRAVRASFAGHRTYTWLGQRHCTLVRASVEKAHHPVSP